MTPHTTLTPSAACLVCAAYAVAPLALHLLATPHDPFFWRETPCHPEHAIGFNLSATCLGLLRITRPLKPRSQPASGNTAPHGQSNDSTFFPLNGSTLREGMQEMHTFQRAGRDTVERALDFCIRPHGQISEFRPPVRNPPAVGGRN